VKAKSSNPDQDPSPCILKPSRSQGFGLPLTSPSPAISEHQYRLEARSQDDPVVRKAFLTAWGQQPDDTRGKLNSDRHLVIVRRHKGLDCHFDPILSYPELAGLDNGHLLAFTEAIAAPRG
jgi:hypothetical protein